MFIIAEYLISGVFLIIKNTLNSGQFERLVAKDPNIKAVYEIIINGFLNIHFNGNLQALLMKKIRLMP